MIFALAILAAGAAAIGYVTKDGMGWTSFAGMVLVFLGAWLMAITVHAPHLLGSVN